MVVGVLIGLILLIVFGMPIFYALGVSSAIYLVYSGFDLSMMAQSMVRGVNSFTMLAIPFFYLAGELMNTSGVSQRILKLAKTFVGHFKGGLAQTNILASIIFAGISGSAAADVAALGSVLIPAMNDEGYDNEFSTAITVASSLIGPIIPPSVILIIYGIVAQQSVGKLLLAGIIPGVLLGVTLMIYTYFHSKKMNYPSYPKATAKMILDALKEGIPALIMPIIIVGGVLSGLFTPTESAAIAVLYGVFIGLFFYKDITLKQLYGIFKNVGVASINTLGILATATIFSWVITRARVPDMVINFLFGITSNEILILLMIVLFLMIVGLFMLPSQALIVLVPIFLPVAAKIGVDPIHFGIIMVLSLVLGGATPPVGILLFIAQDISKLPFMRLVKALVPLYIPIIVAIFLVTFIPWISMLLPNLFL